MYLAYSRNFYWEQSALLAVCTPEMIVSDSQGNTEKVNWEKGDIAVLAGGCNVDLSRPAHLLGPLIRHCLIGKREPRVQAFRVLI